MKSFIKTLGIIVLAAVMVFAMAGCGSGGGADDLNDPNNPNSPYNPNNPNYTGNPNGTDEPSPPPPPVDAQTPVITAHPQEAFYAVLNTPATALTVTVAPLTDGGTLTYQWYRKVVDGNVDGDLVSEEASFTPPTHEKAIFYYYVKVTNTITDNGDGGRKSASASSNAAMIGSGIRLLTIKSGTISAQNKVYDGNDTATITGTLQFDPTVGGDKVTLVQGTARFEQANAGENLGVTLVGWYITGDDSGSYQFREPKDLKANITKAPGAAVAANPAVSGAPMHDSITVSVVALADGATTGQEVEYAISTSGTADVATLTTWQEGPVFTGLSASVGYYVYARSKETINYQAGATKVSAQLTTASPRVTLESNGGEGTPFATVTKNTALNRNAVTDPTKSGYTFDYWYTDVALTRPYDFSTLVQDNFTLYAKWVDNAEITMMRESKKMEWIKGGFFTMGSPTNEPDRQTNETQHRVTLSGYWMGKYEVTQEKWASVMGSNPSYFTSGDESDTPLQLPVEQVSWYDCLVFCNKLSMSEGLTPAYEIFNTTSPTAWGTVPTAASADWNVVRIVPNSTGYRLPTEAQWEYACRAGTTTAYSTGATITDNTGWYGANSNGKTHKVGLKPTGGNAWGLYDMHGNVCEWCWDWYDDKYGSTNAGTTVVEPTGPNTFSGPLEGQRVRRGGVWFATPATLLRSARRESSTPYSRAYNVGLRVVRP